MRAVTTVASKRCPVSGRRSPNERLKFRSSHSYPCDSEGGPLVRRGVGTGVIGTEPQG
jgi:hypothetical protein